MFNATSSSRLIYFKVLPLFYFLPIVLDENAEHVSRADSQASVNRRILSFVALGGS